ncbi:unnamed protein product [Mytilus edulis]|uniref:C-type lectin domain-containing protein n=1 Tax=Mytilus edulis TaxID=6550 RepID=A0A8S3V073_MYTED|nr:unnamed protein product [Mytilus edulis]
MTIPRILKETMQGATSILLCPGDDWNLYGSKCYKITDEDVSYEEGQIICTNETLNSTLVMPKTKQEVEFIKSLYSNLNIWLGLRFRKGSVWMWNDNTEYDASMLLSWSKYCPTDPALDKNGLLCYTKLLDSIYGVTYDEAKDRCSNINGTVIMPKTKEEADWIASKVYFGSSDVEFADVQCFVFNIKHGKVHD